MNPKGETTDPILEHRARFTVPASTARVFQALTDPADLQRWFANRVGVELCAGGRYAFFGSAVLGTPGESDATQTLTSFEAGRRLGFTWTIGGVPTEVHYALEDGSSSDASELEITHRIYGRLPFPSPRHVIDDMWRLHVGNLMAYLRDGRNVVLPDFSDPQPQVVLSIEIAAPPAKVFRVLMEPELMTRWLGGAPRVDRARSEYSYGWTYEVDGRSVAGGPTRILEIVENEKLVTDWPDWRGDPQKPPTRVTWLLEPLPPDGKRTRLTLIHSGFEHPADRSDYQQGWGEFTQGLKKVAEEQP